MIFLVKKGLSRRLNSDHGVAMELAWHSIAFLQSSCCDSLHSQDTFTALTMHALPFHRICTALTCVEDAVTSQRTPYNLCKCHRRPRCLHNDPCVHLRSSYCVVGDLTASTHSVYSQRLLAMPLRCCGNACYHTARTPAFCIFLRRRGIIVRMLLWCDRGLIEEATSV